MSATKVYLPNGFKPRGYQERPMRWLDNGGTRAITVWHRRGGKDLTAAHQTSKMMHRRRGAYWHLFPTAEQGRKALWEGFTKDGQRILEQVFPAAIRKSPRYFAPHAEMVVELKCGSIWRLQGSDKMELVGAGPVGVVLSEFALSKPSTWDLIRPMLRENDGWAWFITTPRGKNHAHKLFTMAQGDAKWFCDLKTLYDTRAYDPEATIAEERASGMPEELIQQEYFCDWNAANVGSFYGVLLAALEARGGLGHFEHGNADVFTSWDLGRADDTSIWWWRLNEAGGVDLLDHYSSHGEDLAHYFDIVETRAATYGWRYTRHWLPHDAKAKTLATRVSVYEQAQAALGKVSLGPLLSLKDGIAAARKLLAHPGTRIHARCSEVASPKDCDGLEALRAYHREWDDARKAFSERPLHDWSSHTADAFRYVALVPEVTANLLRKPPPEVKKQPVVVTATHIQIDDSELFLPSSSRGRGRI